MDELKVRNDELAAAFETDENIVLEGSFCGRYGEQYKDFLEAYHPDEYDRLRKERKLLKVCKEKNEEIHQFIEDTVKALLVNNPAPPVKTDPLGWTAHINALRSAAEEMAEPTLFGGKRKAELGEPTFSPVGTDDRRKNMFYNGTQEEWEKESLPF